MVTTGERLTYFIENQGIDLGDFSKDLDLRTGTLKEILENKRPFGNILIARFGEKYPHVSLSWVLLGQGEMILHKNVQSESVQNINEPTPSYGPQDLFVNAVIKCLDVEAFQDKLIEVLKSRGK